MKNFKRILAALLSVVMLCTVTTATAFADDVEISPNTGNGPNIIPLPGIEDNIETDPHTHIYEWPKYDKTEHTHWWECDCGDKKPAVDGHSYVLVADDDGTHVLLCFCGYELESSREPHNCDSYFQLDDENHIKECTCGYKDETTVSGHSYSRNYDNEYDWLECNECGYKTDKRKHTFTQKYDSAKHWKECTCGYVTTKTAHAYGANYVSAKATLTADGAISKKCSCGAVAKVSTISKIKTVSIAASATYTGKAIKPKVTVKDAAGKTVTSYKVVYSNNTKVGKATAKITFSGNYSGTKTLTFKIVPKKTSISSLKAGKKSLTVKYKKQTSGTGYEIQYSTDKKFKGAKTVKISKNKTVSKTIKKLKSKKTYYVRVRVVKSSYKSDWSAVKKVKVK